MRRCVCDLFYACAPHSCVHLSPSFVSPLRFLFILEYVSVAGNRLTQLPSNFHGMCSLRQLDLGTNMFEEFPAVQLLQHVTSLDMCDNDITTLPKDMDKLSNLKVLNLSENRLIALPRKLCKLSTLVDLHLVCNELTTLPTNIGSLLSLRTLCLDQNMFKELPPEIGNLPMLTFLSLTDNELDDLPDQLIQLRRLGQLKVDGNPLNDMPPNVVGGAAVFNYITKRVQARMNQHR
jgi:internalin A